MVMGGNETSCDHFKVYTDVELECCTLETYDKIVLTKYLND